MGRQLSDAERNSPRFNCWSCDDEIVIPKSSLTFPCPHCAEPHRLVDYLEIGRESPDDWSREDTATALRNVMETLKLFHLVRNYLSKPDALARILFIKDGPLLLRAALSRLIEPIRALIEHIKVSGLVFNLIGVEKTGDLVAHIEEFQSQLPEPGDCFIPLLNTSLRRSPGNRLNPIIETECRTEQRCWRAWDPSIYWRSISLPASSC